MKDRLQFLFSKRFYTHIGIMFIILIVLFVILTSWLSSYTSHGEKQEVPDFTGMDISSAQKLAEEQNLIINIQDTLFSENCRPGSIIDHTPKSGRLVKEHRTIYVSVNSTSKIMVLMPKVFDISLRQAQHILARNGLKLGRIEYKPDIAENYVFEQKYNNQTIEVGSKIPKGSKISLVVGKGSLDTKIIVPSIIGETYENASIILDSLGVNYNPIFSETEYETEKDSMQAIVWKQTPTAGTNKLMMLRQTLDFWLEEPQGIHTPENMIEK